MNVVANIKKDKIFRRLDHDKGLKANIQSEKEAKAAARTLAISKGEQVSDEEEIVAEESSSDDGKDESSIYNEDLSGAHDFISLLTMN